jgi:molecular chaperone DnaK (HSP70)
MELVILGVVAAVVIAAWWVMNPKEVEQTVEEIEDKIEEVVEDVKEDVKEALDNLPSVDDLKKLTKAKLEELGRELGVELDKRKTKDNMIKELQSSVKEK